MKPETCFEHLLTILGWQGGMIFDACREIGLEVQTLLYESADFPDGQPSFDFRCGYADTENGWLDTQQQRGNLQYWFGAIAAMQNRSVKDAG